MTAVRETISALVTAALSSAAVSFPGGAATVERAPRTPIEERDAPAVSVFFGGMQNTGGETGGERRVMSVELEIMVAAADEVALDQAVNEAHAWAVRTVLALNDNADFITAGQGSVQETEMTDPELVEDAAGPCVAAFGILFDLYFETAENDPSQLP